MRNCVHCVPTGSQRVPRHGANDRVHRVPALLEDGTRDTVCRSGSKGEACPTSYVSHGRRSSSLASSVDTRFVTTPVGESSEACHRSTMPNTVNAASSVIGSRIPIELAERVRRASEAEDRSVSYFTRRALRHELERVDEQSAHDPN
jgi:hypothetical protein